MLRIAVFVAAVIVSLPSMALTLVEEGRPTSVIVLADRPTDAARVGAQELQYHLEQMSGATIPIRSESEVESTPGVAMIFIGGSSRTEALGQDPAILAQEGYMVRTVGGNLVILGDDAQNPGRSRDNLQDYHGTAFGVYDFLQDQLGVSWLWPGKTGEFIPRRATIEVGPLDVVDEPALKRRHMRRVMNRDPGMSVRLLGDEPLQKLDDDEALWYQRMRMGRSMHPPSGHAFTDWWGKYKDTHPEVFAKLPNGERGPANPKKPDYVKMDVANPDFWELQLEEFKAARAKNPNIHELPCNENDGKSGFCTCELCKAWDITAGDLPEHLLGNLDEQLVSELTPGGSDGLPECLSTRYAKWFNEMARRVREIDPDGYVSGYAYARFREIPLGVERLEPNMLIGYVGFNNYPRTMAQRAIDRRDYLGWAHPGIRLYIRPNAPHYSGNGHPYNVARDMADDLKFCIEHGTIMADYDSMLGYWTAWGPTYYVIPRIMWEGADADTEAILDEWFNAFGPAERQVREYYDFWEQYILSSVTAPGAPRNASVVELYPPEILAHARSLLGRATERGASANDSVQTKIENLDLGLTNTELTRRAMELSTTSKDDAATKSALQELVAFRRQIAPRNVINVYYQTNGEMGGRGYWKGDHMRWELLGDYTPEEGPLLID